MPALGRLARESQVLESFSDPRTFLAAAAIVGLVVGSFLNVVIHRVPKMMEREWRAQCAEFAGEAVPVEQALGLAFPASHCPRCGAPIRALDNIPVLSYLWLRGRCRQCRRAISPRYPVVEALAAGLTFWSAWRFGFGVQAVAASILIWTLIALAFIDADTQLLPDSITLPLLWAGLVANLWGTFADLKSAVIGAIAGYLSLWTIYWLFKLATGKEGMGHGDFKLLAALGGWLGWQMLPAIIFLASVVGAAVGIALIGLARHGRNVPIPFGPYLAAAGALAVFWGPSLSSIYLRGP
ncbi:MAG TPA: prepilin peptidase [Rhodocyclaceae bacterium]|nr:prepilin peptidase [Rhodocyclaceae bacterium]